MKCPWCEKQIIQMWDDKLKKHYCPECKIILDRPKKAEPEKKPEPPKKPWRVDG